MNGESRFETEKFFSSLDLKSSLCDYGCQGLFEAFEVFLALIIVE